MLRKTIVDAVEILPLFLFIMVAKLLPLQKKVFLGGVLVGWLIRLNKNLKTRIIDNLQLTMPHITVEEKQDFIKQFGTLAGKTFTELIFNSEFQESVSEFEYKPEELEPLLKAKTEGRPIIIVSAHLGPWEAVRAVLKKNNLTAGAIYKKNKNRFYESIHLKSIKFGGEPIFQTGAAGTKKMIQYLKGGGIVAVMLDQAAEDGEFFNFLGVKAKTSTSIAKLAIKFKALIVPAYAWRNTENGQIHVSFESPLTHTNYRELTSRLSSSIESRVVLTPHQWYWVHRRWKF